MNQKEFKEKMGKAKKKMKDEKLAEVCEASIRQSMAFGENGNRQLYICQEEFAELIQCVSKILRGKADKLHTTEEMADAIIGLEYLKQLMDISDDELTKALNVKLERIQENIQVAKKNGKPFK